MTSVITGDIINSRKLENPGQWLTPLKKVFNEQGKSPKIWEIYRGDSFQLEVKKPEDALLTAIRIKAIVKSVKDIDVRMGIGIGEKSYTTSNITESNGEAFIHSVEKLEELKKLKRTIGIRSPWPDFDEEINLYLTLALIAMDNWSQGAAEVVEIFLENPDKTQKEIARALNKHQSSVSERKTRAHFDDIMKMESVYRAKVNELIQG